MKCYANSKKPEFDRGFKRGVHEATKTVSIIVAYILADKHNFTHEQLTEVAEQLNYFSDSVVKGYLSIDDLKDVLNDEYGITVT